MNLQITAIYAGLCGILLTVLAYKVAGQRKSKKIGLGDGGKKSMSCIVRAHANATEYIPICILLLAISEINHALPSLGLHITGGVLVVARLLHAYGLSGSAGVTFGRVSGTGLTWLIILILSLANIYNSLFV